MVFDFEIVGFDYNSFFDCYFIFGTFARGLRERDKLRQQRAVFSAQVFQLGLLGFVEVRELLELGRKPLVIFERFLQRARQQDALLYYASKEAFPAQRYNLFLNFTTGQRQKIR